MTICGYAVCSDGTHFAGYDTETAEEALFAHIPHGGGPVASTEPSRDSNGWWFEGAIEVWQIHNPALLAILLEEDMTSLACEGDGDFTEGTDFAKEGSYRWGDGG